MIEISPADRSMVQAVVDNMRADDRMEMLAAGTDLLTLAHMLVRHSTFTFCAWGYDCGPISIWGLARKRPGVCSGYAFGTDDWPRAVLPMVRHIRGFVLPFLVDNDIHRVDAVALRRRDDVRRFMGLIGARAEAVLTGYGAGGEDFVSYRWLSDEYGGYRASESDAQAVSAYAAH